MDEWVEGWPRRKYIKEKNGTEVDLLMVGRQTELFEELERERGLLVVRDNMMLCTQEI